jgi:hypothetical protein
MRTPSTNVSTDERHWRSVMIWIRIPRMLS